jgi:O-antigen chain-terminating methyltransferase
VDDRFDFPQIRPPVLTEVRARLSAEGFAARVRHQESLIPRRAQLVGQPIWKRVVSYLISLQRLTWTRRQTGVLEDEIGALRRALLGVAEADLALINAATAALGDALERAGRLLEGQRRALEDGGREQALKLAALEAEIAGLRERLQFERLTRQRAFSDFDRRLARGEPAAAATATATSPGVQSLLESVRHLLEDRCRGSREEVKQRLQVYRNDWRAACERTGAAGPAIDIGCGRGELVELMAEDGLHAVGIDSDETRLEAARRAGCPVVRADALSYLRGLESGSVLAVSAIQVAERLPFPVLAELMQEAARVLRPGGVVILETPNPRNLMVGASTFHLDPTRVRPLPPEALQALLEAVGYGAVEIRPLHPSPTLAPMLKDQRLDPHIAELLFGPQDYAAIGVA